MCYIVFWVQTLETSARGWLLRVFIVCKSNPLVKSPWAKVFSILSEGVLLSSDPVLGFIPNLWRPTPPFRFGWKQC